MKFSAIKSLSTSRDIALDSVRGVAIILMVLGHVIGSDASTGLKTTNVVLHFSYGLLADLRMPLFTVLSGFVYALRPALSSHEGFTRLIRGKVKRLLIPLMSTGTVFMIVQALIPGTNSSTSLSDVWQVYVLGSGHFWFLQAIFLIFVTAGFMDLIGMLNTPRRTIITLVCACILSFLGPTDHATLFSWGKALHFLPYFLLGVAIKREWDGTVPTWPFAFLTIVGLAARVTTLTDIWTPPHFLDTLLSLAIGLCGTWTFIASRHFIAWRPLATLGWFSYPIYLLHVFGTASTRIFAHIVNIDSIPILLISGLLAGLLLPILVTVTLGRSERFSRIFLGQAHYRGLPQFSA